MTYTCCVCTVFAVVVYGRLKYVVKFLYRKQLRVDWTRRKGRRPINIYYEVLTTISGELRDPPTRPITNEMHNINIRFIRFFIIYFIVDGSSGLRIRIGSSLPPSVCITHQTPLPSRLYRKIIIIGPSNTRVSKRSLKCVFSLSAVSAEETRPYQNTPDA